MQQEISAKRLEQSLTAFFIGIAVFVVFVYLLAPNVYTNTLMLAGRERYPLLATLFLVALLGFIGVVIFGIRRHWRWLFWLLLIAFSAAILEIPATFLLVTGRVPNPFPLWYDWCRCGVAVLQVGLAALMWRHLRRFGVWAG
jgi:hypothetical protein